MNDNPFLPDEIPQPDLKNAEEWTPEGMIEQVQKLTKRVERLKPAVEDIIMYFWTAHELIVTKHEKWKGWTWGRFCEECGYSDWTPMTWFQKYGLSYTRSDNAAKFREQNEPKKLGSTPAPTTDPEIKEKLKEVNEAIKQGEISNKDLESTRKAINGRAVDKERQEEFKNHLPKKSKVQLLNDKMASIIDDLTYLADGNLKLEEGDEKWVKAIMMKGPNVIWQFHKLGVDLQKVYKTLINPGKELGYESKREERTEWNQEEGIIDVTPRNDP